jgi:hypothetical protein
MYAEHNFEGTATRDESWFHYSSYSDSMFAESRESVVPRNRRAIPGQQTMVRIFFTSRRLLVLIALRKGAKFHQDYFIQAISPGLYNEKMRISCQKGFSTFSVHRTIRCVMLVTRCLRNLPIEALNELHTHLILQT